MEGYADWGKGVDKVGADRASCGKKIRPCCTGEMQVGWETLEAEGFELGPMIHTSPSPPGPRRDPWLGPAMG